MPEVFVPFFVLGGFLVVVAVLLLLAVRRARRGFGWSEDSWDSAPASDGEERE